MFHIAQRDSSVGALCCREKYYSATSSIVLGKYGIKYKCYPLISRKVKFKQNTIFFLCLSLSNYDKKMFPMLKHILFFCQAQVQVQDQVRTRSGPGQVKKVQIVQLRVNVKRQTSLKIN